MSALIIIAHVKDGVDFAVKHKLNPRIIDVIREHHGDSLVVFFYHKAREQKKLEIEKVDRGLENPEDLPKVDEKNFRYPGPRPSTRECGIITLADSIYIRSDAAGQGLGGRLLRAVIAACEGQDYRQMIAVIGDSANLASIRLHAALGFQHAGVLTAAGFKFERWIDSVYMQRALGEGDGSIPAG